MKKITFCVFMMLSSFFLGYSQVSIGIGTNLNSSLPFEPSNPYSYSQSIYKASEINASGNITALKWKFEGVTQLENSQDVTVYLGHTAKNAFASDSDWEAFSNLVFVYSGELTLTESGWITLEFSTPFAYNGTDNLIVAVKENHSGYDSYLDGFYSTLGTANNSLTYSSTLAENNPNPADPPAGYTQNYFPNIIFEGITQICPIPFNLQTTAIGTSTATIAWDAPVNTPSGGSEYFIATDNIAPDAGTEPSGSIASGNTLDLALSPGTQYYLWVRSSCTGDTHSPWSTVYEFVTICDPFTSFIEDFNDSDFPNLPLCWSKIVRGDEINEFADITVNDYEPYSVTIGNGNTSDPTDEIVLIAPEVSNLAAGTHRLKFSAWSNASGTPMIIDIVTLSENAPDAPYTFFTAIQPESPFSGDFTVPDYSVYTGGDYIIDFSGYEGTDTFIGFKLNTTNPAATIRIDNVRWEPIPPCPDVDVTTIEVDEELITENSATLSWGSDGASGWDIVYGTLSATDPDVLAPVISSEETTKELVSLTPNTDYKVWIRSVCEGGNGIWIGPITFKTKCEAADSINENFDASTNIPECWNKIISGPTLGNPTIYIAEITWVSYSDPNALSLGSGYSDTDGADDIIIVSPKLSNIGAGTHRFKFRAYSGSASTDDIQVVTLGNNFSSESMTVVGTFTSSDDMAEHIVDFSEFEGSSDNYIGIRMNAATPSSTLYIDNVIWEPIPPCPDIAAVGIAEITTNSAVASWSPGGEETAWQVAFGPITATDPNLQTIISTTTLNEEDFMASANLSPLDPATEYNVWVRSTCGEEGNGQWSVPVTFKTDCLAIDAINENFDTTANTKMPDCWAKILRGETLSPEAVVEVAPVPANLLQTAPNTINIFKATSGADADMIIVSPQLSNVGAGTHRLTFYATYLYAQGGLEIGTLNNNNPDAIFTPFQDVALTTTSEYYEVDFSDYEGTDTYFGIRMNSSGANTVVLIDNLIWEPVPTCPHITVADVAGITDTAAEVIWEAGAAETAWQVVYDVAAVTSPDGLTPIGITVDPATILNSLTPATQYNVWIRSVCESGTGLWAGPFTFKTDCQAVSTFSQNFDTTTTPSIPECWSAIKSGETLSPMAVVETAGSASQSAPNAAVIYKATSGINDDLILVSPNLSNLNAGTHSLSFYAMIQNSAGELQIGTLNNNSNEATFTVLNSVTPTAGFQQFTIDFSDYEGTDKYIGIRLNSAGLHTVTYIDNIVWEAPETICTPVSTINENFDTTPVETIPECWTPILRGPTSDTSIDAIAVKTDMTGLVSEPNAMNIFKGLSGPTDEQILVLPQVSNLSAGTHKLSVHLAGPPCQIEVGTLNNNSDTAVFTVKQTIDVAGTWTQTIVDFTNYTGTDTYIGLRLIAGDSPFVSMYIDNVIWSPTLGNEDFNSDAFSYYPNPVKDILNLSYDKNITNVAVYNLLGQEILTRHNNANQYQVDMSSFASGTYIVRVTSDNKEKIFKVNKQ